MGSRDHRIANAIRADAELSGADQPSLWFTMMVNMPRLRPTDPARPVPVAGGLKFGQVGAGGWNACGKTLDNVGYCWGLNDRGQLGDGTLDVRAG